MLVEIIVPDLGESVAEATVGHWHKAEGDLIAVGDVLVVLETAKVTLEVGAQASGKLASIKAHEGDDVQQGEVLGTIEEVSILEQVGGQAKSGEQGAQPEHETTTKRKQPAHADGNDRNISPLARRIVTEHDVDLNRVEGSGPNQRITRDDVDRYLESRQPPQVAQTGEKQKAVEPNRSGRELVHRDGREERVRMTRRRRTIASRLVEAQQATAMLTTFNDVDMSAVMDLRQRRKEQFQEKYSVKLGLTSFFIKAAVGALKTFPRLNAEIDGTHIILKHYYDIGVAIGDPEGLIVPVIRDAGRKTFVEIETDIRSFARAAEAGTISLQDLQGGTFTVTNGGIFGSLLSTPILNPPQVGILGLHRIEDRPVAVEGQVVIRPMMYLALSYDHRMVDGREAVQFLAHIKQLIEEPERLLLES